MESLPKFFVFRTPDADPERFVILRPEMFLRPGPLPASVEKARRHWEQILRQATAQSEQEIRRELADLGLTTATIDKQFERARHFFDHPQEVVWERTTSIGSRNAGGQVVTRKLDAPGAGPFERLYVLRCERCGHEHEAGGSEVHGARCTRCPSQDVAGSH